MTSASPQTQIPSQASNTTSASQSTPSYASTAKKAVSSPPIATGSSTPSPAVAVGGSAPVQHHGKSASISPVNGRPSVPPAVPAVSAPAIAHGSSATNGGSADHSRKASVTISASGTSGYIANGGPVGGSKGGIQFGSITDSPAASHSTPQIAQPAASAPIAIPSNPRVTSPAQSPSPIPQPSASGGRPPSGLAGQGNGVTFGSLGGDGDVSLIASLRIRAQADLKFDSVTCDKHLAPKVLSLLATRNLDICVESLPNRHRVI
jgi:translation initiation factor 4G